MHPAIPWIVANPGFRTFPRRLGWIPDQIVTAQDFLRMGQIALSTLRLSVFDMCAKEVTDR